MSFFFALKVRFYQYTFELFQNAEIEARINLRLTGKLSLKFDFSLSLLLVNGC